MYFDFVDSKLVLADHENSFDPRDAQTIIAAKDSSVSQGHQIISTLEASNCDTRFIEGVSTLCNDISCERNVIHLGMMNNYVQFLHHQFEPELPDALTAMLRSYTLNVSMYVGQFPDWHRFVENAAIAELDTDALDDVRKVTENVISQLQTRSDIIDADIPKTFRHLQLLICEPSTEAKKAAFAILRSIENLVGKTFLVFAEFLEQTTKKTLERMSGALSKAIVVGIVSLALVAAVDVIPVTDKLMHSMWLKTAVEMVMKDLPNLK